MAEEHTYTMSVDLAIIESLGINLYSNAAAVLSELFANMGVWPRVASARSAAIRNRTIYASRRYSASRDRLVNQGMDRNSSRSLRSH